MLDAGPNTASGDDQDRSFIVATIRRLEALQQMANVGGALGKRQLQALLAQTETMPPDAIQNVKQAAVALSIALDAFEVVFSIYRKMCGARTRKGGRCGKAPMRGKKRCRLHGGCSTGPTTTAGRMAVGKALGERNKRRSFCGKE